MKVTAFAPGHITVFFEPVFFPQNFERTGSRGAGINISLGVTSQVMVESSAQQTIFVQVNGLEYNAPVTKLALQYLIGETPVTVLVKTVMDLPVSQGFGMSAGGALSASLALTRLLGLPKTLAIQAAHFAEVQLRTGLGDVVASSFGGIEIRREAGLPPWGMLEHIPGKYEVVLCVMGEKIETTKILTDKVRVNDIMLYGRYCIKKLLEKPSIENFFILSQKFTRNSALASDQVLKAIDAVRPFGRASMCMLGNSVFAIGETKALCNILSGFGTVFCGLVDELGARILVED